MNAPFARTTFPSLAVQADSAYRASLPAAWHDPLRAIADELVADVAAGRKVVTEHGIFTPHDLACAVEIEGGVSYPTRSCGVVL